MAEELLVVRGIVEADPGRVAELLLDVRPGGRSPLAVTAAVTGPADGDTFTVTVDGSRLTVTVDRDARSITQQGEWWYRGTTAVTADPSGSLLTHTVLNIATRGRSAVRFVARGPLLATPAAFAGQLREIGVLLGCAAYPLDVAQ